MNLTGRNRMAPGDDNVLIRVPGTGLSRVMTRFAALGAMAEATWQDRVDALGRDDLAAPLADSGHPSRLAAALVRLSPTRNPFPGATEQES